MEADPATVADPTGPERSVRPIDPGVRIGHVHLEAADLERALAFYCGELGFGLVARAGGEAAFVAAGAYHRHIGRNTWESNGGSPPARGATGLHHLAILYPTRGAWRRSAPPRRGGTGARRRLGPRRQRGALSAQNGVELAWDRPRERWPAPADGGVQMVTRRLDLEALSKEGA